MRKSFKIKRIILADESSGQNAVIAEEPSQSKLEITIPCELEEARLFNIGDEIFVATLDKLLPVIGQTRKVDGVIEIWHGEKGWIGPLWGGLNREHVQR